jgi:hypothetical protein
MRPISTMRVKAFLCFLVVALLMTPVQAGDVSVMQQEPAEDPKQPNANNTTMYLWANGMSAYWTHFNNNDTESVAENELMEEKDNGVINIKYRFTMDPTLDKRLQMTEGGEMRGNFQVYFEGDQTNGDNNGPCQSDCDFLNITVYRGANKVYQHTEQPWPAGNWKNIVFSHALTEEDGNHLWDGTNDNPIIEVTMKVKGDYQESNVVFASGDAAAFGIKLGEDSRLELPVDEASWEESFQAGEDGMMDDSEDTPGFTLVVASAAIGMAMFINASKDEESDE